MDIMLGFFRRKTGITRNEFHHHYETVHAPLGAAHPAGFDAYVVNLVLDADAEYDAVTEIVVSSLSALAAVDPNSEVIAAAGADHVTFMGPQDSLIVAAETIVGSEANADAQEATKFVSVYYSGDSVPPPAAAALFVKDYVPISELAVRDVPVPPAADAPSTGIVRVRLTWMPFGTASTMTENAWTVRPIEP